MQITKWSGIAAAITLVATCFYPWLTIPGREIIISGVSAEGTAYGRPGYLNILLITFFLVFALIPRMWAKRVNVFVSTVNFAWSVRNFILLSRCEGGDCPVRQTAVYIYLIVSFLLLLSSLLTPFANNPD
jgi:hypothetical protein